MQSTMGFQYMTYSWVRCILLCATVFISTVDGEKYFYPDKPDIDFSTENNQTCPTGCELCSDLRFICHQLNMSMIPQTWPVTLQYLELSYLLAEPYYIELVESPFKRYSQLKYLDIGGSMGVVIFNKSFEGLYELKYLKFQLDYLNFDNAVVDMVKYLIRISYIENNAFGSLKRLKYLNFNSNFRIGLDNLLLALKSLPLNTSLDYVDFSNTNDANMEEEIYSYVLNESSLVVFKRLQVKVLKLDRNHITAILGVFCKWLQSIEYLSLRENYLMSLLSYHQGYQYACIYLMRNLKVFDIGANAHLPGRFHTRHLKKQFGPLPFPNRLEKFYIDNFQPDIDIRFYDDGYVFISPSSFHYLDATGSTLFGIGGPLKGLESLRYLSFQSTKMIITNPETFNCLYWPNIHTMLLGNCDLGQAFGDTDKDSRIFQNCSTMVSIDLENTKLSMLPIQAFKDMNQAQFINISRNGIHNLDIDLTNNMNLTLLNASSNMITHLTSSMMSQLDMIATQPNHTLVVDLEHNPLLCDCNQVEFIKWMKQTNVQFHNFDNYTCFSGDDSYSIKALVMSEFELRCKLTMITIATVMSGICIFLILISIVIYTKRHRLEYFLLVSRQFAKRVIQTKKQADDYRKFQYHGFLSYSSNDDISIIVQIQEKMEEEFGLRLAIHDRDFIPGRYIIQNITSFVEASRKVIILMSNNYLESRWCNFEFELSRNKRLDATYDAMVMIMLHDVEDLNKAKITSSLKSYIGQKTYLKWPKSSSQKPTFWLKLKEALDIGDIEPRRTDNDLADVQDEGAVGGATDDDVKMLNLDDPKGMNDRLAIQIEAEVYDDTQPLLSL